MKVAGLRSITTVVPVRKIARSLSRRSSAVDEVVIALKCNQPAIARQVGDDGLAVRRVHDFQALP